jgi:hypothetical protein
VAKDIAAGLAASSEAIQGKANSASIPWIHQDVFGG